MSRESKRIDELLTNARAMADNLYTCPASEQHLTHMMSFTLQAINDLATAIEILNAEPEPRPVAGSEKKGEM